MPFKTDSNYIRGQDLIDVPMVLKISIGCWWWLCLIKTAGANQRKRARETSAATGITTPINTFSLQQQQSQPPQLIDLAQLHNQQPNVVSTGLRLSFGDQQQQQQQQLQQHHNHHHRQQQQQHASHSSAFLSVLAEDFASQIKQQRDEIDQLLQAQVPILHSVKRCFFFSKFFNFVIRDKNWIFTVRNRAGRATPAHISGEEE